MKDERFQWIKSSFLYEKQRFEEAKIELSRQTTTPTCTELLTRWWKDFLAKAKEQVEQDSLFQSQIDDIEKWLGEKNDLPRPSSHQALDSLKCSEELLNLLDKVLLEHRETPKSVESAAILMGQVVGQHISCSEPDLLALALAHKLLGRVSCGYMSFEKTFLGTLENESETKQTWANELKKSLPNDTDSYIPKYAREKEQTIAEQKMWESKSDFSKVWKDSFGFTPFRSSLFPFFRLLLAFSAPDWCELISNLKHPGLQEDLIRKCGVIEDIEIFQELLTIAPTPFSPEGEWNNQFTLLLLVENISDHAKELERAVDYAVDSGQLAQANVKLLADLREKELPEVLRNLYTTLLQRQDGSKIVMEYMQVLLVRYNREFSGQHSEKSQWSHAACAINALVEVMVHSKVGYDHFHRLYEEQKAKESLLILLSAFLVDESTHSTKPEKKWKWFEELLENRDSYFDSLCNSYSYDILEPKWVYQTIAEVLLECEAPLKQWEITWKKLGCQRRKAAHQRFTQDRNAISPSMVLLIVGIALQELVIDQESGKSLRLAQQFWELVNLRTRELWISQPMDIFDTWPNMLQSQFAYWPHLHKNLGSSERIDRLTKCIIPLGQNSQLITITSQNLKRNGIPTDELLKAYKGAGFDLVEEILQWKKQSDLSAKLGRETFTEGAKEWLKELQTHQQNDWPVAQSPAT